MSKDVVFVPYVCCGDPSLYFSHELVKKLAQYSDFIELGVPFSDPIADGKIIQDAIERALKNGTTTEQVFSLVEKLRQEGISTPFIIMTYYNIVYSYGCERFLRRMRRSSVQGIIIPDLPFQEDGQFEKLAKKHGIGIIDLIAPNTSITRAKQILRNSEMFTYLVSAAGTTGRRDKVSKESLSFVRRIRKIAGKNKMLLVGFGVSTPEQAKQFVKAGADGIVVGSAIIDIYSKYLKNCATDKIIINRSLKDVRKFATEMCCAQK